MKPISRNPLWKTKKGGVPLAVVNRLQMQKRAELARLRRGTDLRSIIAGTNNPTLNKLLDARARGILSRAIEARNLMLQNSPGKKGGNTFGELFREYPSIERAFRIDPAVNSALRGIVIEAGRQRRTPPWQITAPR